MTEELIAIGKIKFDEKSKSRRNFSRTALRFRKKSKKSKIKKKSFHELRLSFTFSGQVMKKKSPKEKLSIKNIKIS
jgi:hypothetical protein